VARVAVVGNLSLDVVDAGKPSPGGCPTFAAEAFRRLDASGQIVTRLGEQDRGLFRPTLDDLDVSVTLLQAGETTSFAMDYDGDTRSMRVAALGEPWQPADAAALEPDVDWVHVAPLLRGDFTPPVLEALAHGRRLSLDGQGLVRLRRLGPLQRDADYPPSLLSCVTALKLSEQEAQVVAGGHFGQADAAALAVPEILLTLGSQGVLVFVGDDESFVPARPVRDVHATGAGDTFMVGYAAARVDGREPVEAAELACALVTDILEARRVEDA
jgi:sugar/nucleoside kinase (ribokinase family)